MKVTLFVLGIPLIYITLHTAYESYYNVKPSSDSLFIWGDSQIYQGVDLDILQRETNRNIYTAARHGAGIYDFLVFAESVPLNSEVLVAISKPVQLRRKEKDRNTSGLSLSSLKYLLQYGYTNSEVLHVIKKNLRPSPRFLTHTTMYDYNQSAMIGEPLELFQSIYNEPPSYLFDKQNLYLRGIQILKVKNCKIHLIEFPYDKLLSKIENRSSIKVLTDRFADRAGREANCAGIDTLLLNVDRQVMHDLTHLNCIGAQQVSLFIANKLNENQPPAYYVVIGQ